jgi:hypothetical protein
MVNAAEDVAPQRRKDGVTLGTRSSRHAGACEAGRPVARRRHGASDLRNAPARESLGASQASYHEGHEEQEETIPSL